MLHATHFLSLTLFFFFLSFIRSWKETNLGRKAQTKINTSETGRRLAQQSEGHSLYGLLLLLLSHFSRVRLCDPIDGSPPGSPVPGILQARSLEWVATSFSNA